ncbi:M23 family metallopeptidase [Agromyces sp. NPDC058484]|uniref:M23 family metallopeptidase n=1 Tax=Agromyces sp. NPDC058484 TaxID=3346524 RepID=UPI003659FF4D
MTSPKHGRRAAPKTPRRLRTRSTRDSARTSRDTARHSAVRATPATDTTAPAFRKPARPRSVRPAFSALAMTFVGGMMLATSVPALAITATDAEARASVYAPVGDTISHAPQTIQVGSEAALAPLAAGSYAVEAAPPPVVSEVAGVGSVSVVESGLIVWPVVSIDRIASGFGPRSAPCGGCSTYHDGIDFNPGNGTPVMSIADGVVVLATENGGGLGVNVEVQHNIGGELITSSYGHMQYGSLQVVEGQQVSAGQELGLVGSTGQSTGPHLHLEMFGEDGERFDGFAWLSERIG